MIGYTANMDYILNYQFNTDISPVFQSQIYPLLHDKSVLDMGCGKGDYLQSFGKNSLGLDISPQNIKQASTKLHPIKQADLNNPPVLKQKFEAIFLSHVLEHVDSPINLLRYANKQLKTDGTIVVAVPNELSIIHMVYPYYTQNGNHLYNFTIANMQELLLTTGFTQPQIYFDYYTNLTSKLHLNSLLSFVDYCPQPFKSRIAWAHWFVSTKI